MANGEVNSSDIDLLPSDFKFHDFHLQVGEVGLACQIIMMQGSLFLWIGDCNEGKLSDLSFGFMSRYDSTPVATKLMGSMDDTTSSNIAKRLTKKCGKPIYVSFNANVGHLALPAIEKSLHDEFKRHPEILASS